MRIDFTQENKSKGNDRFDKLTLKKDETARVGVLEIPVLHYVHTLKMPVVDPATGLVVQVEKKDSKGDTYLADADEWVGGNRCDGDTATVREAEIDPANCMLCRAVQEHPTKFTRPEAKYASHVVRYKTAHGTTMPQQPFQVELLLWVLTQRKFDKIISIASEHGNPLAIDLILGPCISGTYQNYEIAAGGGGQAYWQTDQSYISHVQQLFAANAASEEQVADTVGFKITPTRAAADIEKVLQRYAMIGHPTAAAVPTEFGTIQVGGSVMPPQTWDGPQAAGPVPDFLTPPAAQVPQAAPPQMPQVLQAAPPQMPQVPQFQPQVPQEQPQMAAPPQMPPAPQVPQFQVPQEQPQVPQFQVPQEQPQVPQEQSQVPQFQPQVPQEQPQMAAPPQMPPAPQAVPQEQPQAAPAVPDFAALLSQVQQ